VERLQMGEVGDVDDVFLQGQDVARGVLVDAAVAV
jgi:hypothetical protein